MRFDDFTFLKNVPVLRTDRLMLRAWREEDLEAFAALNADPVVMEHFPATLPRAESDAAAVRIRTELAERGFGLWAVEAPGVATFLGFTGLSVVRFEAPFTSKARPSEVIAASEARSEAQPSEVVEIGWRLARPYWGRGYATEAARRALAHAFGALELDEVVSFTAAGNARSRRVMEKLGMTHDPADDFDHPSLPAGHPLRRHVLYRVRRAPLTR